MRCGARAGKGEEGWGERGGGGVTGQAEPVHVTRKWRSLETTKGQHCPKMKSCARASEVSSSSSMRKASRAWVQKVAAWVHGVAACVHGVAAWVHGAAASGTSGCSLYAEGVARHGWQQAVGAADDHDKQPA